MPETPAKTPAPPVAPKKAPPPETVRLSGRDWVAIAGLLLPALGWFASKAFDVSAVVNRLEVSTQQIEKRLELLERKP